MDGGDKSLDYDTLSGRLRPGVFEVRDLQWLKRSEIDVAAESVGMLLEERWDKAEEELRFR